MNRCAINEQDRNNLYQGSSNALSDGTETQQHQQILPQLQMHLPSSIDTLIPPASPFFGAFPNVQQILKAIQRPAPDSINTNELSPIQVQNFDFGLLW